MINIIDQLNTLIASNQPDKAMTEMRGIIREFKINHPDQQEEIDQLERQIILHSARMRELEEKERNIQLSASEIDVARARMYSALLGIISSFGEYPALKEFLSRMPEREMEPEPAPKPVSRPLPQTAGLGVMSAKGAGVDASSPSNNKMLFGVIGAIALVALLVVGFLIKNQEKRIVDPNPVPAVVPLSAEEEEWEEAKARREIVLLDHFIEEFPQSSHVPEARALKTELEVGLQADDDDMWNNLKPSIEGYQRYLTKTRTKKYSAIAEHRIDSLQQGMSLGNKFKAFESMDQADTLTTREKLVNWESAKSDNFTGKYAETIDEKISSYTQSLSSYASITDEGNFVVCSSVSGNNNPSGITDKFRINTNVYAWARVNSPRSESIKVAWFDSKGKALGSPQSYSVQTNTGLGFRIYASERFPEAGRYEVRLLNSQGQLIGRRVFSIE